MSSTGDLLHDLQAADPAVDALVRRHLDDHDEILPHVLMAEITAWLLAEGPHRRVLQVLEEHLAAGDQHVQDVIGASFLENILGEQAAAGWALGPGLAAALARMEAWEPDDDEPLA